MKRRGYINNILIIIILILINILSNYYFTRIDLTTEKKYSISEETKSLIKKIDDIIYFKIYLHGDIPIKYQKLSQEIKYMLNELRAYSRLIEYEFIDPSSLENVDYKITLQKELYDKGISPIPHRSYENNKMEEVWVFPGITVSYKSKETVISLINETLMNEPNEVIKTSIEELEYSLISSIRTLTTQKKKVGLISGHGETIGDLINAFKELIGSHYQLDFQAINGRLNALDDIDCIIINNPTKYFTEKDKFIIDQFIMNGGKSIWVMSGTNANMDSLETRSETVVMPRQNRNLNDLLFKYGVRINTNLVQDLQAAPIPIVTHYLDEKPQWTFFPWTFFPILNTNTEHLITTNINPIKSTFPSSIDIINNSIKKTVLLKTTVNTKILDTPAIVNLENLKKQPSTQLFNNGEQIISVLLEGVFESVFKGRIPMRIQQDKNIQFKGSTLNQTLNSIDLKNKNNSNNQIIIISDGHFIKNQFLKGTHLPLGFDKHTGNQYGNGDFILNCIDYLLDNKAFIKIRSKNIDLRLLNRKKLKLEKTYWQLINLIIPLIIILIIGVTLSIMRKRKYTS